MPKHAAGRMQAGNHVSGRVVVSQRLPIGLAVDEILVIAEVATIEDFVNRVLYVPLT
jgi:hypothetical protein